MTSRESEGTNVLSVDLGSSSVRAALYDASGRSVAGTETKLDYDLKYAADGGVVKDADEILDLIARAIDGTLSRVGDARISGAAMSTFWHAVLGLDREGRTAGPQTPRASCARCWTRQPSTAAQGACSTRATGPPSSCG